MIIRGIIIYFILVHMEAILRLVPVNRDETFKAVLYDLLIPVPVMLFLLWYIGTSILMFLAVAFYNPSSPKAGEYEEIDKFLDWRDNKMKFMSYPEAQKLMQDSSILNNLDKSNPEAKQTLDYINNKMRFMSYPESLEFLKGKK